MWKRPRVSKPPMSMHSTGHAWAHWKHVSHLMLPNSSYSSCSRPRNRTATSGAASGYWIVAFGAKKRRSVSAIPLAMPRPGTKLIAPSPVDQHDGGRRHEKIEKRGGQQQFPGKSHKLVDADSWQGRPHPDEDKHEEVRLTHEPCQAADPVESDEACQAGHGRDDHEEKEEAEAHRAAPAPLSAAAEAHDQGEKLGSDEPDTQDDAGPAEEAERKRVEGVHGDQPWPAERGRPAAEEEGGGQGRDAENI